MPVIQAIKSITVLIKLKSLSDRCNIGRSVLARINLWGFTFNIL